MLSTIHVYNSSDKKYNLIKIKTLTLSTVVNNKNRSPTSNRFFDLCFSLFSAMTELLTEHNRSYSQKYLTYAQHLFISFSKLIYNHLYIWQLKLSTTVHIPCSLLNVEYSDVNRIKLTRIDMIYQKLNTENFPQLNIVCTFAIVKKSLIIN